MKTIQVSSSSGKRVSRKAITRLAIFTGLIFSALFAISTPLPITNTASAESKKTIRDYFKFPQILATRVESKNVSHNTVEVLFTTNESGHVNFALAKTQNEELKKEVEKQFYKLYLPKLKQDVVHSVVLNFKTL
jgi:hypothetical protein